MRTSLALLTIAVVGSGCGGGSDPTGGGSASLSVSPVSYAFPNTDIGGASAPYLFTITNSGTAPSGPLGWSIGGLNPGDFQVATGTCVANAPLPGGAHCTVGVVIFPQVRGGKSGSLDIAASPGGSPSASLTGTGLAPEHITAPAAVAFPNTAHGSTSDMTITIMNDGDHSTPTVEGLIQGADASQWEIVDTTCPDFIAPQSSCNFTVRFAPTTAGAKNAQFVMSDPGGAIIESQTALSGLGT